MTQTYRTIALLLALTFANLFLICSLLGFETPIWILVPVCSIGAGIGIAARSSGGTAASCALAGSALAMFSFFAFVMSVFGRLLGP